MLTKMTSNWWALTLRGVLAIVFGILALIWPGLFVLTLVLFFGAYAFVDGIFAIIAGLSSMGRNNRWWAMVLIGLAGCVAAYLPDESEGRAGDFARIRRSFQHQP